VGKGGRQISYIATSRWGKRGEGEVTASRGGREIVCCIKGTGAVQALGKGGVRGLADEWSGKVYVRGDGGNGRGGKELS